MTRFKEHIERASVLVEALPYIQRFRGKTMVIKYGGSAMENPKLVDSVLRDIVFLEAVGINPVIVHGGGKAITKRMEEKGLKAKFVAGLRVTDSDAISIVDEVLNTVISPEIARKINSLGGKAVNISGREVFRVKKAPSIIHDSQQVDLGFVGDVTECKVSEVNKKIASEVVPVISPVGDDGKGQAYNINADVAAAEIAVSLKAFKIIYLSDVNGILLDEKDEETKIPSVDQKGIDDLKKRGVIKGGMLPKVDSCMEALRSGVEKVHLIDGRIPHSLLLELFTDCGIGTEIVK